MRVFMDTEFTQLYHQVHETKMISIGLYTEDCRRYFYAELTDNYTQDECSDFVREVVLPLLDASPLQETIDYKRVHARMTRAQCAEHLSAWIAAIQEPVEIISDAPNYDWPLLTNLFQDRLWPPMLLRECRTCYPSDESERLYLQNQETLLASFYRRHHALDDAKVMALCNMSNMINRGELSHNLHLLFEGLAGVK